MSIISLDIDGVVANLADEMIHRMRGEGIDVSIAEFKSMPFEDDFPVYKDWFQIQASDPVFWLNCKPYEDAWHMINKWFYQCHDIYFVTARPQTHEEVTRRWLDEWDFPYNDVIFSQVMGKHEAIIELKADFFVEDRLEEANMVASWAIDSYVIDRPWNQGHTIAKRVSSFYEIDEVINGTES